MASVGAYVTMGILLVVIGVCFLSSKGVLTKFAYSAGAGVDVTLFYRYCFSVPLVFSVLALRGKLHYLWRARRRDWIFLTVAGFWGYYLASKFDYIALAKINVGVSRMILFTNPVFVVIINAMLKRRYPAPHVIVAIVITEVGLFFVLGGLETQLLNINLNGVLFSLGAALSYAIYLVLLERYGGSLDSQFLTAQVITFAWVYMSTDLLLSNSLNELILTPRAYFWILLMALFTTALPLTLLAEAIKRIGSNYASLVSCISPVLTMFTAYIVLGEILSVQQLLGTSLILGAIFYLSLFMRKAKRPPAQMQAHKHTTSA